MIQKNVPKCYYTALGDNKSFHIVNVYIQKSYWIYFLNTSRLFSLPDKNKMFAYVKHENFATPANIANQLFTLFFSSVNSVPLNFIQVFVINLHYSVLEYKFYGNIYIIYQQNFM